MPHRARLRQAPFVPTEILMTDKATELTRLLSPTVETMGLALLGIDYLPAPGGAVVRLYIDVPEAEAATRSVGIEDCEAVSHEVSAQLDLADPISGHYTLEVSSPGVDRPLFDAAQFARFVGQQAKVTLKLPLDGGRRRLQGRIVAVDGQAIRFDLDGNAIDVQADNIEKARLVPDWVALGMVKTKPGKGAGKGKPAARSPDSTPSNQAAADALPDAE